MAISAYQPPAGDGSAPSHTVANKRIICIEHPCIVRDSNRGVKSLGGEHQLKHVGYLTFHHYRILTDVESFSNRERKPMMELALVHLSPSPSDQMTFLLRKSLRPQ